MSISVIAAWLAPTTMPFDRICFFFNLLMYSLGFKVGNLIKSWASIKFTQRVCPILTITLTYSQRS